MQKYTLSKEQERELIGLKTKMECQVITQQEKERLEKLNGIQTAMNDFNSLYSEVTNITHDNLHFNVQMRIIILICEGFKDSDLNEQTLNLIKEYEILDWEDINIRLREILKLEGCFGVCKFLQNIKLLKDEYYKVDVYNTLQALQKEDILELITRLIDILQKN